MRVERRNQKASDDATMIVDPTASLSLAGAAPATMKRSSFSRKRQQVPRRRLDTRRGPSAMAGSARTAQQPTRRKAGKGRWRRNVVKNVSQRHIPSLPVVHEEESMPELPIETTPELPRATLAVIKAAPWSETSTSSKSFVENTIEGVMKETNNAITYINTDAQKDLSSNFNAVSASLSDSFGYIESYVMKPPSLRSTAGEKSNQQGSFDVIARLREESRLEDEAMMKTQRESRDENRDSSDDIIAPITFALDAQDYFPEETEEETETDDHNQERDAAPDLEESVDDERNEESTENEATDIIPVGEMFRIHDSSSDVEIIASFINAQVSQSHVEVVMNWTHSGLESVSSALSSFGKSQLDSSSHDMAEDSDDEDSVASEEPIVVIPTDTTETELVLNKSSEEPIVVIPTGTTQTELVLNKSLSNDEQSSTSQDRMDFSFQDTWTKTAEMMGLSSPHDTSSDLNHAALMNPLALIRQARTEEDSQGQ